MTIILVLVACVAILGGIHLIVSNLPSVRYGQLVADRTIGGASSGEIDLEITLRTAAARLRYGVSMAVLNNPTNYEGIILEMARDQAMMLSAYNSGAAKNFVDWVEGAGLKELLYPEALKAVWRVVGRRPQSSGSLIHLAAAMRVRG